MVAVALHPTIDQYTDGPDPLPRSLGQILNEQPSLALLVYSYGLILRRTVDDETVEYPVDPAEVVKALSTHLQFSFNSGYLPRNTLWIGERGIQRIIIEYRPPKRTGLWLEGCETPVVVPLPGLVLIRATANYQNPQYEIYAVKKRPATLDESLFVAPLPNTGFGICWGNVPLPASDTLRDNSLTEDFARLLGTTFNNHHVDEKCKTYPDDVRRLYFDLEKRSAKRWPLRELLPTGRTLRHLTGRW